MNLSERIKQAPRTYIVGNGGSYANAVHICNDLLACGVRAYTLDPASLTASANDYGYEHIFSRWLRVVAERGDMLIALSGSGKSPNIINAVAEANRIGMDIECVFGSIDGLDMQQAEEWQIVLGHKVMQCLKKT